MRCFALTILFVAAAVAMPTENNDGVLTSAFKFVKECGESDLSLCIKERALRFIDGFRGDYEVSEGVSLVQSPESARQLGARSLNEEPLSEDTEVRENQVENLLVDRVARFLEGHTLQFQVPKDSISDMKRSLEEGRKKKGGKKMLLPLLLLLKLKAAALIPLLLGFLALVAFKALIIGKLALLISGVIGIKKLLDSSKSSGGYEAHPHHVEDHYGPPAHGWGRSGQDLAYSAQKQD